MDILISQTCKVVQAYFWRLLDSRVLRISILSLFGILQRQFFWALIANLFSWGKNCQRNFLQSSTPLMHLLGHVRPWPLVVSPKAIWRIFYQAKCRRRLPLLWRCCAFHQRRRNGLAWIVQECYAPCWILAIMTLLLIWMLDFVCPAREFIWVWLANLWWQQDKSTLLTMEIIDQICSSCWDMGFACGTTQTTLCRWS